MGSPLRLVRQETLFPDQQAPEAGDGHWYAAHSIKGRLVALMADGLWRTLGETVRTMGGQEASISAQLRVPQYDMAFALPDHSLLMFDGQGLLHGVTPIVKDTPAARRFSVVYYSLAQMWKCETPAAELKRIRKVKTYRERKRADV